MYCRSVERPTTSTRSAPFCASGTPVRVMAAAWTPGALRHATQPVFEDSNRGLRRRQAAITRLGLHGQHVLPVEPWLDALKGGQAPEQQGRTNHENARQRHFHAEQPGTGALVTARDPRAGPQFVFDGFGPAHDDHRRGERQYRPHRRHGDGDQHQHAAVEHIRHALRREPGNSYGL